MNLRGFARGLLLAFARGVIKGATPLCAAREPWSALNRRCVWEDGHVGLHSDGLGGSWSSKSDEYEAPTLKRLCGRTHTDTDTFKPIYCHLNENHAGPHDYVFLDGARP